jgi:hypothetical protein
VSLDLKQSDGVVIYMGKVAESNETVVMAINFCGSELDIWFIASLAWQALLLLPGSIITFVARRVREDRNNIKTMAMVLGSQFSSFEQPLFISLKTPNSWT